MVKIERKIFKILFYVGVSLTILGTFIILGVIIYFSKDLPDHRELKNYNPPITTRLYTNDGRLLKEYAKEKRLFVPIEQIPDLVKKAFLAAEDASFYYNMGIDFKAIIRAGISSLSSIYHGGGVTQGASTITQQVAKNFLLTSEKTITRKAKEAILSIRITQAFRKDEILELYLNQIFLGNRSFGIASAAVNYFDKALDELTIEEAALLASLPKAPSKLDPTKNDPIDVKYRRDWVIDRMQHLGYITKEEAKEAVAKPVVLHTKNTNEINNGKFFSSEVRKSLEHAYGVDSLMEDGYIVRTTMDPDLQEVVDKALKKGIEDYDVRHGYRGALGSIQGKNFDENWPMMLSNFQIEEQYRSEWEPAVVLVVNSEKDIVEIGLLPVEYSDSFENNEFAKKRGDKLVVTGFIPLKNMIWAKKFIDADRVGGAIKNVADIGLKKGDVIMVEKIATKGEYFLKQIPEVNGAVVAMNPHTGRILAMAGGYIDSEIAFNRATQAERQPGSVLKTFAYLAALENGYTPASIIMDEEIELYQGENRPPYKPKNYRPIFYGPTTLRVGLEQSRNVTTVRLASDVGLGKVTEVLRRFGINRNPKRFYSVVLGSLETNLIKMTRAYAMIVNGGKEISPSIIEKIQDKKGRTIYRRDRRKCNNCNVAANIPFPEIIIPNISDNRKSITDSATAYQVTSLLEGTVQRGTAWKAKAIGKPLGGKTGTTNDSNDVWFIGFSPDLVVGVYVGFDKPQTLGKNETGSSTAAPIFVNIMKEALKDYPSTPFRIPSTVKLIKIDTKTGYYPTPASNRKDVVLEAFKESDQIIRFEDEEEIDDFDEFVSDDSVNFNTMNNSGSNVEIQEENSEAEVFYY